MSLLSSFQQVSSRSITFFYRSICATKKCFQHLSHGRKSAGDMAIITDEDVIEFYTKDRLLEERKIALHGEVPDCFRTNNFCLSIEGQNWVSKRDWKDSYTWANVYLRNKDSEAFQEVMRTETVAGDRHPRFTTRAYFSPLTMKNSQNHAMNTTVRIDAYFKETMFASKQVNLAQLLWSMAYETRIESPYPPRMSSYSGNVCKIRLNLLKGRSAEEDVDDSEVVFIIQMKRSVWTKARDSKLFMTVSSVAGYGQWSRCYVSELLTIPTKTMNTRRFSSFKLNRGDLIGNSLQNPFRVEILGTKKGISTVHGFIQIPLPSASRQRYVSWNQSISSYLKANVILHATVAPPNRVSLSFHIGTDGDADEVCTNTERHENVTGGNGKLRKTWDAVMAQTNRSYQSLRSSSGSSDSSEVSSPDKRRGKTHPAGPQYHVRFPTFG